MSDPAVSARSPDGEWLFADGCLRSARATVHPREIDFFERWTFARFLPTGQLVLAFESGQPWSDFGSYGERYGGVEVLAPTADPARWALVGVEFVDRRHDESFVPDDVAWHPRGVFAWLREGCLYVQVLGTPRGEVPDDSWPGRDSDTDLDHYFDYPGAWTSLSLDDAGLLLTARDAGGVDRFDLAGRLRARDDGPWEPLEVYTV